MDAEAMRAQAGHAMSRLHQRYDLILCPTVPSGPCLADASTTNPVRALMTEWAPWTFTFNITRQPAITMPLGFRSDGMPNSVQIAAAQHRDDLVLRAARAIERVLPVPVADPGFTAKSG
jgi:aspartyl-tRNA(Asn)/glutamyl-tRNA(Gln) amidotransferase subunit A